MSEHHAEIIIVKRKGGHGGGHHGGAWKIAFADFMTAMMAFFLVLWIINATDKDTRTVIARYFNPVKLENPARARKGVHGVDASKIVSNQASGDQSPGVEPNSEAEAVGAGGKQGDDGKDAKDSKDAKEVKDDKAAGAGAATKEEKKKDEKAKAAPAAQLPEKASAFDNKAKMTETALFSDPYVSLDKLAKPHESNPPSASPEDGSQEPMRESGSQAVDSFRDPFKPVGPGGAPDSGSDSTDQPPAITPGARADNAKDAADKGAAPQPLPAGQDLKPESAPADASAVKAEGQVKTAAQLALAKDLQDKLGALEKSATSPSIDVRSTDEGLLISLTDRLSFSMFAAGSAEPSPELIHAMDGIASVLKSRPGSIVVRGHTDGRPYKTATYDNWRLSSARAQMAYYMLVRGGVPEARIDRVEGHADHALRDAAHPLAAENRRVEILLREAKP